MHIFIHIYTFIHLYPHTKITFTAYTQNVKQKMFALGVLNVFDIDDI